MHLLEHFIFYRFFTTNEHTEITQLKSSKNRFTTQINLNYSNYSSAATTANKLMGFDSHMYLLKMTNPVITDN